MARNKVQFQKGRSEAQFAVLYGTEDQCREAVMRSEFGSLYRSCDPSGGGVEFVGLLSRAAFLVSSVCYDSSSSLGRKAWRAAWDLSGWATWAGRWRSTS